MTTYQVVENADYELVPVGSYGVMDDSGNLYGTWESLSEAVAFIKEETKNN